MLLTKDKAVQKIANGETLIIAGDQEVLSLLPKGNWIGGSIPYFISENGGVFSKDKVFVTELDSAVYQNPRIAVYDEKSIPGIANDAPENGLTFLIIPFGSEVHTNYARKSPEYKGLFLHPIVGWISGVALDEIGKRAATITDGANVAVHADKAVALHCEIPSDRVARIGIINIFSQGLGDSLEFGEDGFDVRGCLVNGKKTSFARYLADRKIDTKLPLVGNYAGAMINVSFQSVDPKADTVRLYAPVFKNVVYKIASPVGDYVTAFDQALKELGETKALFSCNCILNYLYGGLEGKRTGSATGPITFGEIAYQLLNQTFVYVEV